MTAPALDLPELSLKPELREELRALGASELEILRVDAKSDLLFLSHALGYNQVTPYTHGALCQFILSNEWLRKLILMPRGHLKTTLKTIVDNIRRTICDPENARILIANEVEDNAIAFLSEIKAHWTRGEFLRMLFPELIPTRVTGPGTQWAATTASVNRSTVYKESTYTAIGVGAAAASKHYTHITPDDIIGERVERQPALMATANTWSHGLEPLLDMPSVHSICWVGTRYLPVDTYSFLMETYGAGLAVFSRSCWDEAGEPIFPLKFSKEYLLKLEAENPFQFYAQYLNNPINRASMEWGPESLRSFGLTANKVVYIDPLTGNPKQWMLSELDVIILCDVTSFSPISPDKCAIVVVGTSADDEAFVLHTWLGRPNPTEYNQMVFELAQRWRPRVIGVERAGQQNTIHYLQTLFRENGQHFTVEPNEPKNRPKDKRIRTNLDPLVRTSRLFTQLTQVTLRGAVARFPSLKDDEWDELDALAYLPERGSRGIRVVDQERRRNVHERIIRARGRTGYGG